MEGGRAVARRDSRATCCRATWGSPWEGLTLSPWPGPWVSTSLRSSVGLSIHFTNRGPHGQCPGVLSSPVYSVARLALSPILRPGGKASPRLAQ